MSKGAAPRSIPESKRANDGLPKFEAREFLLRTGVGDPDDDGLVKALNAYASDLADQLRATVAGADRVVNTNTFAAGRLDGADMIDPRINNEGQADHTYQYGPQGINLSGSQT